MTLIECQSPLKVTGGVRYDPLQNQESLSVFSIFFIFAAEMSGLGNALAPFKPSFPFEECYSQNASCHSVPCLYEFARGPTPAQHPLVSIPEGILPAPCVLELHKERATWLCLPSKLRDSWIPITLRLGNGASKCGVAFEKYFPH